MWLAATFDHEQYRDLGEQHIEATCEHAGRSMEMGQSRGRRASRPDLAKKPTSLR
jgi:hypothetical protein